MNSPVVLITGALSEIGKAAAEAFARAGYRIAISGRRDDAGQALCRRVARARRRCGVHPAALEAAASGKPEEIADAIAFLASDKAAFINGQIIDVNGGITKS
jgi:NAD(P)-dependent dehydrogenase (short-subunit alcohol dehydrogenase family)